MSMRPKKTINFTSNYFHIDTKEADPHAIKMMSKINGLDGRSGQYLMLRIVRNKKYIWFSDFRTGEKVTVDRMLELLR